MRINLLAPAMVRSPAAERTHAGAELQEFVRQKQPCNGGMIDMAEVARTALLLRGEESRSMTAEVLTVTGGWRLSGV